jgi:hypothetical protein
MYEETPNKEEIDWFADRLREIYSYEELKDCDIDYLHNLEFRVENRELIFKAIFPSEQSAIQGEVRAALHENENDDREALTQAEKIRLDVLKREIENEIHRAKGHRIRLRREHKSEVINSISDAFRGLAGSIPTPW